MKIEIDMAEAEVYIIEKAREQEAKAKVLCAWYRRWAHHFWPGAIIGE